LRGLDQSDVDNGQRLIAYFGRDLLVRQEDDVAAGQMLAWTGTHWDLAGGEALAHLIGQKVGDLIKQEADYLEMTPPSPRRIGRRRGCEGTETIDGDAIEVRTIARVEELSRIVAAAKKARSALSTRKTNRRKWGVATKNAGRISNMLKCAAPHLRRHPDAFNADPLKVATLTHTLTFVPVIDDETRKPMARGCWSIAPAAGCSTAARQARPRSRRHADGRDPVCLGLRRRRTQVQRFSSTCSSRSR
jgi:putative DNA primase/helicase